MQVKLSIKALTSNFCLQPIKFYLLGIFILVSNISFGQAPTITSFSPTSGVVGTSVTITGTNFNTTLANNIVWLGGVRATVTAASAISLTVTVPAGIESKTVIRVLNTSTKLIGESSKVFNLTFPVKPLAASNYETVVNFTGLLNNVSNGMAVGDLDGDGKTEVVVATDVSANGSLVLYRNIATTGVINGSSFNASVTLDNTRETTGARLADFNGDGKLDIVVSRRNVAEIGILENQSSGVGNFTFGTMVVISVPVGGGNMVTDAEVADIDGDGKIDIVTSNRGNSAMMVSVFRNVYTSGAIVVGSFTRNDLAGASSQGEPLDVGDVDNDGKPDIVAATNAGAINIFENNSTPGTISFSAFASRNVTAGNSRSVAIADFDGDGLNDIAVTTNTTLNIDVFRNTNTVAGTLSFPATPTLNITGLAGVDPFIYVADVDGDGKKDLLYSSNTATYVRIFRNTSSGPGNIAFAQTIDINRSGGGGSSVALVDLDGDGLPDLSMANMSISNLGVARYATSTYYSAVTGNWNNASTWSTTCGGGGGAGVPTATDNVVICNGNTVTLTADAVCTNLTVNVGGTLKPASSNLTVNGNTQINGTFLDDGLNGTNIFNALTVNAGGVFQASGAAGSTFEFRGNIIHSGTTFDIPGVNYTFSTNPITILANTTMNIGNSGNGTGLVNSNVTVLESPATVAFNALNGLNIAAAVVFRNQNQNIGSHTLIDCNVSGLGTLINDPNAALLYGGASEPMTPSGTFAFSAADNIVGYYGTNQTVRAGTYENLFFANGSTKTLAGNITVNKNIQVTGASTIDVSASNFNIDFKGSSWLMIGASTLNARNGTVTFSGTTTQSLTNDTGNTPFYNLTINNTTTAPNNKVVLAGAASNGNITVSNALTLTNGRIELGTKNLTYSGTEANLTRSTGWLETNGTGAFIRTGTPVGTNNFYVGDATAMRNVTLSTFTNPTSVRFTSMITPAITGTLPSVGMWVVNGTIGASTIALNNVGANPDASSKIHTSVTPFSTWTPFGLTTAAAPNFNTGANTLAFAGDTYFTVFTSAPSTDFYTIGNATWNANGNWSNTDGGADCGCNPAGVANANVRIKPGHTVTYANVGDMGTNNTIDVQGTLQLDVKPTNTINVLQGTTGGGILKMNTYLMPSVTTNTFVNTITNTILINVSNAASQYIEFDVNSGFLTGAPYNLPNLTISGVSNVEAGGNSYPMYFIKGQLTVESGARFHFPFANLTLDANASVDGILSVGNAASITVSASRVLTVNAGGFLSFDNNGVTIAGTLTNNGSIGPIGGGGVLTINNGAIFNNAGSYNSSGGFHGTVLNGTFNMLAGGSATLASGGFLHVVGATGVYNHQRDGGVIPAFTTWNALSNCNITGITTLAPTGFGQSFGNFTWNTAQGAFIASVDGNMTIKGNFTMTNSGTGSMGWGAFTHDFKRNVTQTGGIIVQATSTAIFSGTSLQTITGGFTFYNLTVNNASGVSLSTSTPVVVTNALTLTNGRIQINANNLVYQGSEANLSRANGWINTNSTGAFVRTGTPSATNNFYVGDAGEMRSVVLSNFSNPTSVSFNATISPTLPGGASNVSAGMWTINSNVTSTVTLNNVGTGPNAASIIYSAGASWTLVPTNSPVLPDFVTTGNFTFSGSRSFVVFSPLTDFYTLGNATWNVNTNWSNDGSTPCGCNPFGVPNANVRIQTGHMATVSNAGDIDLTNTIDIQGTGILTLSNGNTNPITTLTTSPGSAISVNAGTLNLASPGTTTINGTAYVSGTGGVSNGMIFAGGSSYIHARDGGAIPTAIWVTSSTINITGVIGTAISGASFGQNFGNFIWNCVGQTVNQSIGANMTVAGNLTVSNTNTGNFSPGGFNLSIKGNLSLTAGTFNQGTSTLIFNGAGPQTITGIGTLYNVNLNQSPASTLTLSGSMLVQNALGLTNGRLVLGANNLTFGGSEANLIRTNGWIHTNGTGSFIRSISGSGFTFPVGNATQYQPLRIVTSAINASVRFGASSITVPNGGAGAWFVNNASTNSDIILVSPVGTNLSAASQIAVKGTSNWSVLSTTGSPNYQAAVTFPGTTQEVSVFTVPTYNSRKNGNWTDVSPGNGSWSIVAVGGVSCDCYPVSGASTVIGGGNTITSTGAGDILSNNITLQSTGTLSLSSGNTNALQGLTAAAGSVINLSGGTLNLATATTINGTLNNGSGGIIPASPNLTFASGSTYNNQGGSISTTTLTFANGATYNHAVNGGTIPTATWGTTSTVNITGITTTAPTGFGQTFGNFSWNNASQSAAITINATMTVTNLTLSSTNGSTLVFGTSTINVKGDMTHNIGASFDPNNSTFVFNSATVAQTLNGASGPTFYNLVIDNTSAGGTVTMSSSSPYTVNNALTLTTGRIVLAAGNLAYLGTPGNLTRTSGWVQTSVGKFGRSGGVAFTFPVGSATQYQPITISTPNNPCLVRFGTPTIAVPNSGAGSWFVDNGATNSDIVLLNPQGTLNASSLVYKYNAPVASSWNALGTAYGAPNYTATAALTGVAAEFSVFTPSATTFYSRATGNWDDFNTWSATSSGSGFTATITTVVGVVTGITPVLAGTGYGVSNRFTIPGGSGDAQVIVTSVNGSGGITSLNVTNGGTGYSNGAVTPSLLPVAATAGDLPIPVGATVIIEGGFTVTPTANNQLDGKNITLGTTNGAGTLDLGTTTHGTVASLVGTNGNGTLSLSSGNLPTFTSGDFFAVATNTVSYQGGAYSIANRNYPTLEIGGSGSKLLTGGTIDILGNLNIRGGSANFAPSATINFPNAGILPHLIQGDPGNQLILTAATINGNTTLNNGFGVSFDGLITVASGITLTNNNQFFQANATGDIAGAGTFVNRSVVNWYSNLTPSITTFDLTYVPNTIVYQTGTASLRNTTYYDIVLRNNRATTAGTITANTMSFDNSGSASGLNLANNTIINLNGNLALANASGATIDFGVGNGTIVVGGNLTASTTSSTIIHNAGAGSTQLLELRGTNNTLDVFNNTTTAGTSIVRYNLASTQDVFGSANYRDLEFAGGGNKILNGAVTASNLLALGNNRITLGANNLTYGGTEANLTRSTGWIETNGSGAFVRTGTPIGANNFYVGDATAMRSVVLSNFSNPTSVSFNATVSPTLPGGATNASAGMWVINSNAISTVTLNNVGAGPTTASSIYSAGGSWTLVPTNPPTLPNFVSTGNFAFSGSSSFVVFSALTDFYTIGNATWNANGNWSNTDGGADCGCNPAGVANANVRIKPGHTVAVANAGDIGLTNIIDVQGTGILTLSNGNTNAITTLTNAASSTINVNSGTLNLLSPATTTINGTVNVNGAGVVPNGMTFANGATYNHNRDGGNIPTATWGITSNCNTTGVTTTGPTGFGQIFGNFTWNNAGQGAFIANVDANMNIDGNFVMTSSGSGSMGWSNFTLSFGGNVSRTAGNIAQATSTALFSGSGVQTITGGFTFYNLNVNNSSGVSLSTSTPVSVSNALTLQSGTIKIGGNNLVYQGTEGNLTRSSGWVETNGTGAFVRSIAGGPFTFPVGNATQYQPLRIVTSEANASVRFGTSSISVLNGGTGSWFVNNGTTTSTIILLNPQGTLNANSLIYKYNTPVAGQWNATPTNFASPNYGSTNAVTGAPAEFSIFTPAIDYYTIGNAAWDSNGNWSNIDGGGDCGCNPKNVANANVRIKPGHTATVANAGDIGLTNIIDIQGTGILTLSNGNTNAISTLTNAASSTINVNAGTLNLLSPASTTINGTVNVNGTGVVPNGMTFANGATYNHNRNGGTIPTATWGTTSTMQVTGMTNTLPIGLGQGFGNFIWNCTGQTVSAAIDGALDISGDFSVISASGFNFDLQYYTHTLRGNINDPGSKIFPGTSTVVLQGTTTQSINGGGLLLYNLTVDNSTAGVILNCDLQVAYGLSLVTGVIQLNSSDLRYSGLPGALVLSGASWVNTNSTGLFYNDDNSGGSVVFPVGNATQYQPIQLSNFATSATVRYGTPSITVPNSGAGSWYVDNGATNSDIILLNPQGTLNASSKVNKYNTPVTGSWNELTTSFASLNYTATGALSGTSAEFSVFSLTPTITLNKSSLVGITTTITTPSAAENFIVNATNLTVDAKVKISTTDYEVSLDAIMYYDSLNITQTGGNINAVLVSVRLKSGLSAGSKSATLTVSSTGAIDQTISLSGTVTPGTASLTTSSNNITGFATNSATPSASQGFDLNGSGLSGNVSLTISTTDYEISTDNINFVNSLSLTPSGGIVFNTLYVRLKSSLAPGSKNATITISSSGATDQTVTLSGTVDATSFITTWTATGGNITIPGTGTGYNYNIAWTNLTTPGLGDGNATGVTAVNYPITGLANGDTYRISISGTFPQIYLNGGPEATKLLTIEQWGNIAWGSMTNAFSGCTNMTYNATDVPDLSAVTSMSGMFNGCSSFDGNINSWSVSTVTDMSNLFQNASTFNQPLNSWTVSSVTNMSAMFNGCSAFNQDISTWNVGSVTNMFIMFQGAILFNQDISNWTFSTISNISTASMFSGASAFNNGGVALNWGAKTNKITNMSNMFTSATSFNQDISSWDVSNVTNMYQMFFGASTFNQPLNSWNVSGVTNMFNMFRNATSFNQPLNSWNVANVTDMTGMFNTASAFNQDISSWNVSKVTLFDGMFQSAAAFNQDLSNWTFSTVSNISAVSMFSFATAFNNGGVILNWGAKTNKFTNMLGMFAGAITFNQDISGWDVSNVTDMSSMFANASAFNQSLASWNIINVTTMANMLDNTALSVANYDATLVGWAALSVKPNVPFGANSLNYCSGATARTTLGNSPNLWTITDAGLLCVPTLTASTANISGFLTTPASASTSQSFTVSGSSLTLDATVSLSNTNFELSVDNTTFSATLVLAQSGGILTSQPVTVYVRLVSGLAVNSYNTTLTINSTGASDQFIGLSGTVTPLATLSATTTSLSGFAATYTAASTAQNFTVSGSGLTTSATVTVSTTDYELSTNNSTYTSTLTLTQSSGSLNGQPVVVYVRLKTGLSTGSKTATLTVSSTGATDQVVSLSGTTSQAAQSITFNALSNKITSDVPFNLTATATSGLTVSYSSSNTGVATISGNTVTITGAGTTSITASQAGNANYLAATNVIRTLTVIAVPNVPTLNNVAPASLFSIKLDWADNSNDEDGFEVWRRRTDSTSMVLIKRVAANIVTYTDPTIQPGFTYFYRVKSYNVAGASVFSNQFGAVAGATVTGIDPTQITQEQWLIYPNPTQKDLLIQAPDLELIQHISLFDNRGVEVYSQNVDALDSYTLDMSIVAAGVYELKVITKSGKILLKRVVKE